MGVYGIDFSKEAESDLKRLKAFERHRIVSDIFRVLTTNPKLISQSRIKLLRQPAPAQYRLRVGDFRVFYDVRAGRVEVLRILLKSEALQYGDLER